MRSKSLLELIKRRTFFSCANSDRYRFIAARSNNIFQSTQNHLLIEIGFLFSYNRSLLNSLVGKTYIYAVCKHRITSVSLFASARKLFGHEVVNPVEAEFALSGVVCDPVGQVEDEEHEREEDEEEAVDGREPVPLGPRHALTVALHELVGAGAEGDAGVLAVAGLAVAAVAAAAATVVVERDHGEVAVLGVVEVVRERDVRVGDDAAGRKCEAMQNMT